MNAVYTCVHVHCHNNGIDHCSWMSTSNMTLADAFSPCACVMQQSTAKRMSILSKLTSELKKHLRAHVRRILTYSEGNLRYEHRGNHRAQEFMDILQALCHDAKASLSSGHASTQTRPVVVDALLVVFEIVFRVQLL